MLWGGLAVAILRAEAGRDPYDKALTDLVGELCTRSHDFRVRWAAHDVRLHRTGLKHIHHPVVGDLHLSYEVMELLADPGLAPTAFSAGTGSTDDDGLKLLASWAATTSRPTLWRHPNSREPGPLRAYGHDAPSRTRRPGWPPASGTPFRGNLVTPESGSAAGQPVIRRPSRRPSGGGEGEPAGG